jgi:uncharacterized Zn finger protein (UPF0148 family)
MAQCYLDQGMLKCSKCRKLLQQRKGDMLCPNCNIVVDPNDREPAADNDARFRVVEVEIAQALASFDDETEARLCAFLNQAEKFRSQGGILGWRVVTGPEFQEVGVDFASGEILVRKSRTLNEAIKEFGRALLEKARAMQPSRSGGLD